MPKFEEKTISLTSKEKQVASLLVKEKSNQEIAEELNVGVRSSERHTSNIINKLSQEHKIPFGTFKRGKRNLGD